MFLSLSGSAHAEVVFSKDLHLDGQQALDRQVPILLEFSADDCLYCQQLEREFLVPMLISGDYSDKVIIRRILVNSGAEITDFDATRRPASEIASRYRAWVTPTLLFLDGTGRERAERMVGFNTPELYGGYLDACIDTALLQIRDPGNPVEFAGCKPLRQP